MSSSLTSLVSPVCDCTSLWYVLFVFVKVCVSDSVLLNSVCVSFVFGLLVLSGVYNFVAVSFGLLLRWDVVAFVEILVDFLLIFSCDVVGGLLLSTTFENPWIYLLGFNLLASVCGGSYQVYIFLSCVFRAVAPIRCTGLCRNFCWFFVIFFLVTLLVGCY